MDRVERRLYPGLKLQAGSVLVPPVEESVEGAEQEVARTARRIDQPEPFERPFLQRRFQGLVEDELLHEYRGLQQRIRVLRVLGQVLVQVAEEPRGQRRVRQVVDQRIALAAIPPEVEQLGHRVTGRRDQMQRRTGVNEPPRRGKRRKVVDGRLEPFAVGVFGMSPEERELRVQRLLPALTRPGDPDRSHQRVVLAEPYEHGCQHPRNRHLRDPVIPPGHPRRRRALLIQRPLMLLLPVALQAGVGRDPSPQIVLQQQNLPLQISGQG